MVAARLRETMKTRLKHVVCSSSRPFDSFSAYRPAVVCAPLTLLHSTGGQAPKRETQRTAGSPRGVDHFTPVTVS